MKINKSQITQSVENLSKSTTNKFWGVIAIVKSIEEPVQPNKTYKVDIERVMSFLDELFNLDQHRNTVYSNGSIYVKFSNHWKECLQSLTLKNRPELTDASIFYSKFNVYDSNINSSVLKENFLNDCKIRLNGLSKLFTEESDKVISMQEYDINELISDIEVTLNTEKKENYHLSLDSPYFIKSKPSELKRAPFIQTLYSGDRIKELLLLSDTDLEELYPVKDANVTNLQLPEAKNILEFYNAVNAINLKFDKKLIARFTASLLTKPFVILTGLSGSGKTKLAQAFVQWICQDKKQYRLIPVGADWTNREPLLGYPNALKPEEYVKPDSEVLDLIIRANAKPDLPHFLILDEMNLSHVERYFADFLSVMESNDEISLYNDGTVENGVPAKLRVPSNLFIVGTVNIDETTNMFSPKVLDRANTIEFRVTAKEMEDFLNNIKEIDMDALHTKGAGMAGSFLQMAANKSFGANDESINKTLVSFFNELKKTGAEFGYRSASEILRLINQLTLLDEELTTNEKVDIAIMQKLLPKLHGSRRKLCPVLETLGAICISGDVKIVKDVFENDDFDFSGTNVQYPLSLEKIARMYNGAISNGFASFAEA